MLPRSRVICSAHRVTDGQTDGKFMDPPIPSPKHNIPNHPLTFLPSAKKLWMEKIEHFATMHKIIDE